MNLPDLTPPPYTRRNPADVFVLNQYVGTVDPKRQLRSAPLPTHDFLFMALHSHMAAVGSAEANEPRVHPRAAQAETARAA